MELIQNNRKEIIFNGRKYREHKDRNKIRMIATTRPRTFLSRDMWEYYTGEKLLIEEEIHHRNDNTLDDRMDNFTKIPKYEHSSLHHTSGLRSRVWRDHEKAWRDLWQEIE